MPPSPRPRTLLAVLLVDRGWTAERFCRVFADTAAAMTVNTNAVSDRTVKRWTAGESQPQPPNRRVLEKIFGISADQLFAAPAQQPPPLPGQDGQLADRRPLPATTKVGTIPVLPPTDARPYPGPGKPRTQAAAHRSSGKAALVAQDADDAIRFLARSDDIAPAEIVDLLWSDVRRLATTYGDRLTFLADDLVIVRRAAFRLLDGPAPPARSRDLYLLAGIVCAMLAHTSRDLGDFAAASSYQNSALICADRSGHSGLRVFARTEQAATAYWAGQYAQSATIAQRAANEARSFRGSLAVLPAIQEARAWAATGRADLATSAIARAASLRDHVDADDLDEIGGILSLPLPEQLGIVAGTAAWLPDAREAERAAREAIDTFQNADPAERSYNSEAIAHADLALARVRQGSLDAAADAVTPVLNIPPERRVHQIRASAARVASALQDPRFRDSADARDTAAAIEAFIAPRHGHPASVEPAPNTD